MKIVKQLKNASNEKYCSQNSLTESLFPEDKQLMKILKRNKK